MSIQISSNSNATIAAGPSWGGNSHLLSHYTSIGVGSDGTSSNDIELLSQQPNAGKPWRILFKDKSLKKNIKEDVKENPPCK